MGKNNNKNESEDAVTKEWEEIKKAFNNRVFGQLEGLERTALLEHYRRCQRFWTHWTPTIWSLPSIASGYKYCLLHVGLYNQVGNK
jgi:hypothetical protein